MVTRLLLGDRRGMALPLVLCTLLVSGALVGAAFFAATLHQRIGENTRWLVRAFGAAEAGAYEALHLWNQTRGTQRHDIARRPAPEVTGFYSGRITRLNDDLAFVEVTGSPRVAIDTRVRVGMVLRRRLPAIQVRAALETREPALIGDGSVVDGGGSPDVPGGLPGAGCDSLSDTARAAVASDAALGQWETLRDDLAERATVRLAGGVFQTWPRVADGRCDITDPLNWGDGRDRAGLCSAFYPIVHIRGDATLSSGHGQGILLVDGDLRLRGSYEFYGLVIVGGVIGGPGDTGQLWGSVVAMNAKARSPTLSGRIAIRYSKCSLLNSLRGSAESAPLRSRGWIQLF